MNNHLLYSILVILLAAAGCTKEITEQPLANQPPVTYLWLYPDSTILEGASTQHIRWWGDDPDGIIKGYLFASGKLTLTGGTTDNPVGGWRWKTTNDTVIAFPLLVRHDTFQVLVRGVDNTFGGVLPDQALVWLTPQAYWDRNEDGMFDSGDVALTFPQNSIDPKGATLGMPVRNQPPAVTFAPNPNDPSAMMQQPDTTYTAATFSWVGTDPDGDKTIAGYRLALNDTTTWLTVQGNVTLVTLFVPRSVSDTARGAVSADLYSGKFLNRQRIGSLPGLLLDSPDTLYLQAVDIAGDMSPITRLPQSGKTWFVKKPRWRVLTVVDYIYSDSSEAARQYRLAFSTITDPTLTGYDEINIGRGISTEDKKNAAAGTANPRFGVLVPPFIDPAFIYTLYLYDYVFWYTDKYPSMRVAQYSLFPYYTTVFGGHKGKVIYSTSFELNPDPSGLLRDFAPIDSVSSVDLSSATVRLPRIGDSRIPGGYMVLPDSQDQEFPTLKFNLTGLPFIYLRPIYRRADAHYIYHMQTDTRNPVRYAYAATLSEMKSIAATQVGEAIVCGSDGVILRSTDGGGTWNARTSGTSSTLNSVRLLDDGLGWIVGNDVTIMKTVDGGSTWAAPSIPVLQNLLNADFSCVDFASASTGVVVGNSGLILQTTDAGASWSLPLSPTRRNLTSVHFGSASRGVAVGDSCLLMTTDGGSSWQNVAGAPLREYTCVRYLTESTAFALTLNGILYRTDDGGESWAQASVLPGGEVRSIFFTDNLNGWICGTDGRIFLTDNGGLNWRSAPGPSGTTQNLNAVTFTSSAEGWCVGASGLILRTADAGITWSTQPRGNINVAVVDGAHSSVFIALPLHLLNGDGGNVGNFLEYVFLKEFRQ
jgi:photosystem II stability/assembly factor-like uncharacterized protein